MKTTVGTRSRRFAIALGVAAWCVLALAACNSTDSVGLDTPVVSITVSPSTATIAELSNASFAAELRDAKGRILTGRFPAWTSSDASIASVGNGLVTGVRPGTVTISAIFEGISGTATVTVSPVAIAFIALSAPSISVIPGSQGQLVASARSIGGGLLIGRTASWISSDPSVASVANGIVVGLRPGATNITATIEGLSATALATVTAPSLGQPTIAVGGSSTCALSATGVAFCWGFGAEGQLGNGTTDSVRTTPVPVSGKDEFVALSSAGWTFCGLRIDGKVLCWGSGLYGALGNGSVANQLMPTEIAGNRRFVRLSTGAGFGSFCAIDASSTTWCWGSGRNWSFSGTGNPDLQPVAVNSGRTYMQVSSGVDVSCLLTDTGVAYCLGSNIFGEQGNGSADYNIVTTPTATAGVLRFTRLFVGTRNVCGTRADGTAWCWGGNSYGQVGDNTNADRAFPVQVAGQTLFERVMPGSTHTCGLTAIGAVWCWGSGDVIGTGTGVSSSVPVAVAGSHVFTEISVGGGQTCGRTASAIYCWGNNYWGSLGDGTRISRLVPTLVSGFGTSP